MSARLLARRALRPAVGLGAGLLLAGCDLSTASNRPTLDVWFVAQEQQPPTIQPPTVTAVGGLRFLTVRGSLIAQCTDVRQAANYTMNDDVITIRLTLTPLAPDCASQEPFGVDYQAHLMGLEPGTYDVRMVHEGDLGVESGTEVMRENVTVTTAQGG